MTQHTPNQTKTMSYPVTDAVRNHAGDYLSAVESLEQSHAELLEALQRISDYSQVYSRNHIEATARNAIAKATGG